jgi:hypothetical protein
MHLVSLEYNKSTTSGRNVNLTPFVTANRQKSNWQSRFYYRFLKIILGKRRVAEATQLALQWLEKKEATKDSH